MCQHDTRSASLRGARISLAATGLEWNDSMPPRRSFSKEGPGPSTTSTWLRPGGPSDGSASSPAAARPAPRCRTASRLDPPVPGVKQRTSGFRKVLAHAGLGSRRACEELILQGRVSVDGQVVRQLGTRVDARASRIAVDGEPIRLESMVYYAVNKPKGYVSTNFDPSGRPRVVDLLPEVPERVYTVGRLDEDSTGLMILTNDGDLANRLAHPRYGVEKLYRALVAGLPGSARCSPS